MWTGTETTMPPSVFSQLSGGCQKSCADVACSILNRNAQGEEVDWETIQPFHRQQKLALEQLARTDRLKLFRTFFGKRTNDVDRAWQWLKSAPYCEDYDANPFRAPKNPQLSLEKRIGFLRHMVSLAGLFRDGFPSPSFLAAWVPYIKPNEWWTYEDEVPPLLASSIDAGGTEGDAVFEILCQSARKEHEVGMMGLHVTQTLMMASRPEGWELMEKMLLAAQRSGGPEAVHSAGGSRGTCRSTRPHVADDCRQESRAFQFHCPGD